MHWGFAMRSILFLAALAFPAYAYTPEQLLSHRDIAFKCDEATKVCTVAQDDFEYMINRDRLLAELVSRLYDRVQSCQGIRGT